jgi:hypothetical protein
LGDGAGQGALGGVGRAEEQDVLTGEDGGRVAVDDVPALREVGREGGAELADVVAGLGLSKCRKGGARSLGRPS